MDEQPFLPFDDAPVAPSKDAPATRPPEPPPPPGSPLIASLARACAQSPLAEKVLIAPSLFVGHAIVERLAREGHDWTNLRVETVGTLALQLVGADLAREGLRLLSRAQALALVEQACGEFLRPGGYFAALRDRPGFHRALQRTFEELRGAGIPASDLPSKAFADRRKRDELRGILARYEAALAASRWVDRPEVLRRALDAARTGRLLPGERLYLEPRGLELSTVERTFLERITGGRLETLETESRDGWTERAARASLFRATGEENEIREVFRRILASGIAFDEVEVVSTEPRLYSALGWELAREHLVPCTFASGVVVTFTRPGQTALAFLEWIAGGFAAESLRRALSSATVTLSRLPGGPEAPGARAAGRALREARVGWGMARHRTALDRLVAELEKPDEGGREDDDADEDERRERARRRERRLAAARRARDFVKRSLELAACAAGGGEEKSCDLRALARATRTFVTDFARLSDELDGSALAGLQKLLEELELLAPAALAPVEAATRLADAVRGLSVESDRARPGHVHFTDAAAGGFAGRRHAFFVGLDEGRHPGADLEDPVLLDAERRAINEALAPATLPLSRDRPRDAARLLETCLARYAGTVTASYSSWKLRSLDYQSEQFPSPFFLELYRAAAGNAHADYTDLAAALPDAAGFSPSVAGAQSPALDETEWFLSQLTRARGTWAGAAEEAVAALYPHLRDGRRAEEARASDAFTVYDGWVSAGTPELDPRRGGEPQSASRLQLLAACPFRYFVRYVLGVDAPETAERDRTRWLDPLAAGQLLHDVFRQFFETITAAGEKPSVARHGALIEEIAAGQIRVWTERIPPRSEISFGERREELLFACRAFLRLEEEHCREVTPRFFEVPFGMPRAELRARIASREPVAIDAGGGRTFLLRGSIDRVDEGADGEFQVWDYKTGGTFGFSESRGLAGGRRIQYALYALALEVLLGRAGLPAGVSHSGYFFPGRKGEGQRFRMPLDLEKTRAILNRLMDLLAAGAFPHAADPDDCAFCDFESVCGGITAASRRAKCKLATATLPALRAFREMHEAE